MECMHDSVPGMLLSDSLELDLSHTLSSMLLPLQILERNHLMKKYWL
jgi:hypothetical protein